MQGEDVVLYWHLVEENCEDTLLHLTGVLGTENDHFSIGKVDSDRGCRCHAGCVPVSWEGTGIVDDIVRMEVLELLPSGSDEHVAHEESMVGAGTDDPHADPVLLIPSCETINDVNTASGVEVVDGTLAVDFPDLEGVSRVSLVCVSIFPAVRV